MLDLRQVYSIYTISHCEIRWAIPSPGNLLMVILVLLLIIVEFFLVCNHHRFFLDLSVVSIKLTMSWRQKWVVGLDWSELDRCFVSIHVQIVFLSLISYDIVIAHLL